MMPITIVGLGPGPLEQMSLGAWRVLESATTVLVRTARHPTVRQLPPEIQVRSFDVVYESHEAFEQVYEEIAGQVVELGRGEGQVVYAVPGHPLVGEATVQRILALARREGIRVEIVPSESFLSAILVALGLDGLDLQVVDATEVAQLWHPPLRVDGPAILGQLYDRSIASEVKLTLLNAYPPDHEVVLVRAAGTAEQVVRRLPLEELDRQPDIDHLTSLYVPPRASPASLESFQDTVARLRSPSGCPWDREQTHQSLRETLLEEAYEVLEALDSQDPQQLRVELGDLLMQICMHAQIATEEGFFTIYDVVAAIDEKIRRRHPHVFGDTTVSDSEEVLRHWEEIKRSERGEEDSRSLLAGVPSGLPALAQANAYQKRVARVGFDWRQAEGVWNKVGEEIAELRRALPEEREAEFGDLLFTLVNLARHLTVDAETALRQANARFRRRFERMQELAAERGLELARLSLEEQDRLWDEAKREERGREAQG
ncbi:MAG: nucleoside triphosphate pyrophosphohydrolase [Anaerolineae bacterium]|nr:nucleoside triphosphate pyrophosphohydrolase [Anaerolineae bacterium]